MFVYEAYARVPIKCKPLKALEVLNFSSQILFGFTKFLLKPSKELVLLAFGEREIVVGQLPIFLFQFALQFVPTPFEFQICHNAR